MVQQSTTGALGGLCWYSRLLQEYMGGSAGTDGYYRSTGEVVLVQKSTVGAHGRLCW